MGGQMVVAFAASRNLYPWLPMAYQSLLDHNPQARVELFIEDAALPYPVPAQVHCNDVSGQRFFDANCANWKTTFTYLSLIRVCYTKLLPACDRVISMDVDTITCGSLQPLWDIDFSGGEYFAAVPEHLSGHKPYGADYRNAGVVVFALDNMRRDGADDKLIRFLNRNKVPYIDQDAINWLNAEMGGSKALDLGVRYNECFVTGESLRPAVVHAAGCRNWFENFDEQYRGSYWKRYEKYCQKEACRAAGIKF